MLEDSNHPGSSTASTPSQGDWSPKRNPSVAEWVRANWKWKTLLPCPERAADTPTSSTERSEPVATQEAAATASHADASAGQRVQPRVVATYTYTTPAGTVLYQVQRLAPKGFRQRRPDPDQAGGWIHNIQDVPRVLYRSDLLAGAKPGARVFVVEGEKDVDRLVTLCLLATTSPMGSGKWREEFGAALAGLDVVILPDNDAPGRKHAEQVARSVRPHARSVTILDLPLQVEGEDVSDWLDGYGGTPEALMDLVASAQPWAPQAAEDGVAHNRAPPRPRRRLRTWRRRAPGEPPVVVTMPGRT